MIRQTEITLPEYPRGFHLVTDEIVKSLGELPRRRYPAPIYQAHICRINNQRKRTTRTVREDFANSFDRLVKEREPFYKHTIEGDDDMPAHIKASLVGFTVSVPITNHHLNLGIWQGDLLVRISESGW